MLLSEILPINVASPIWILSMIGRYPPMPGIILPGFKCFCLGKVFFGMHFLLLLAFQVLEDTARYAGLLLAPAEGFVLWPRLKELIMLFWLIFGNF